MEFNCTIYIDYFIILILIFCLSCPPLGQFIPNFGYAPPQKLKTNHIFWEMMSHMQNCIAFLLSHHSLDLVGRYFFFIVSHRRCQIITACVVKYHLICLLF